MTATTNSFSLEAPFTYQELFFSQTDARGIIQTGNSVFQRVSEYTWDELKNRPHNVIRHPDMPAGVFFLLWKYLQTNKPIGAFVKNKSKSGKYYWVYALAMPTDAGYLSVRLKPGGKLLATVDSLYQQIRAKERAEKLSPEESSKLIIAKIQELGFADYDHFMTEALLDQTSNRAKEIATSVSPNLTRMIEMKKRSVSILDITNKILTAFSASQLIPLNLEIFSQKLGQAGSTVTVVAHQYQVSATEISETIKQFETMSKAVSSQVTTSQFYVGAANLLTEINAYLKTETASQNSSDFKNMERLSEKYLSLAVDYAKKISDALRDFISICNTLNTLGLGLELIRITGKVELAKIEGAMEANNLLESLHNFQSTLKTGLAEINALSTSTADNSNSLIASLREQIN